MDDVYVENEVKDIGNLLKEKDRDRERERQYE